MELLLNRYRNLTVLLVVILAQLVLLAYQVKSNGEVRLIRVWAVTAVTPLARVIEGRPQRRLCTSSRLLRAAGRARARTQRLKADLDRVKMENQFLRTELSTADRAQALAIFQQQSPSKTVAAHVIGNTHGRGREGGDCRSRLGERHRKRHGGDHAGWHRRQSDERVSHGVLRAADHRSHVRRRACISQKNRVHGTLKGQGYSTVIVDYVQNEQKVEAGEWFYTSGDDRIFPKGLPVGMVKVVRQGKSRKDVQIEPSGLQNGLEEVLIVVDGVHRVPFRMRSAIRSRFICWMRLRRRQARTCRCNRVRSRPTRTG